jgi:hypothetical protein
MGALGGLKEMVAATGNTRNDEPSSKSAAPKAPGAGLGYPGGLPALGDGSDSKP